MLFSERFRFLCVRQLCGKDGVPVLVLDQLRMLVMHFVDDHVRDLQIAVDDPVHLEVVVVLAEGVDERLGHLEPAHVEEELERGEDRKVHVDAVEEAVGDLLLLGPLLRHDRRDEERVDGQGHHLRVDERNADRVVRDQVTGLAAKFIQLVDQRLHRKVVADAALLARSRHYARRPNDRHPVLRVFGESRVERLHDELLVLLQQTCGRSGSETRGCATEGTRRRRLTCVDQVIHRRETLLDARRYVRQNHRQTQAHVAHDCSPHQPATFVLKAETSS